MLKKLIIFFLIVLLYPNPYTLPPTYAQGINDVASIYKVTDTDAIDGDILTVTDAGLVRSTTVADKNIFGVLQDNPTLVFREQVEDGKPVARSGVVQVNVTNAGGAIKYGDLITSS